MAELELRRRKNFPQSLIEYCGKSQPHFEWHWRHMNEVAGVLDRFKKGELKRVIVCMPRRHGKTQLSSRSFPSYTLLDEPRTDIGLASYGAELAQSISRNARDLYEHMGGNFGSAFGVKEWETDKGGVMWATGLKGTVIGKGYHLGICDDYFKEAEAAMNPNIRDKVWESFTTAFYTSQQRDAGILIPCTRWHSDDVVGRLLAMEEDDPQFWYIVHLPAICPEARPEYPPTCTVHPEWRQPGEALWPEHFPVKTLLQIKSMLKESFWNAMYQQDPQDTSDDVIWRREWFIENAIDEKPTDLREFGLDWDTAYTAEERNSASAYIEAGINEEGKIVVTDLGWRWLEFPDLPGYMKGFDRIHYVEGKATGKSAVQTLQRDGLKAYEVSVPAGDRITRSTLVSPLVKNGHVRFFRPILDRLLDDPKQGVLNFGVGATHDDVNSAFTQMLFRLRDKIGNRRSFRTDLVTF